MYLFMIVSPVLWKRLKAILPDDSVHRHEVGRINDAAPSHSVRIIAWE